MPRVPDQWRRFRFTLNNPREDELSTLGQYLTTTAYIAAGIHFMVLQTEQGHLEGTTHLQGYCELTRRKASSRIHRIPGFARIALLVANATAQANIDYCSKSDTRIDGLRGQCGTPRRRGQVQTRNNMVELIKAGSMTSKKIIADFPLLFLQNSAGIEKMMRILQKERDFPVQVDIYFGPTGTGKSWMANKKHKGAYKVKWPENGGTW